MQETARHVVDQFVIRPRQQRAWGMRVAFDFFFEGVGAGLLGVSAWFNEPVGMVAGVVLALAGIVMLFSHLGHPERFLKAMRRPRTSWISRGVFLKTGLFAFGIIAIVTTDMASGIGAAARAIVVALAVLETVYPGAVTAVKSIPAWNSALLPMMSLAYAMAAGSAVLLAIAALTDSAAVDMKVLQLVQLGVLAVCVAYAISYVLMLSSSTAAGRASGRLLTRGALAPYFLGVAVLVGLVLPFASTWYAYSVGGSTAATAALVAAAGLRLVGELSFRACLLKAGLYDSLL